MMPGPATWRALAAASALAWCGAAEAMEIRSFARGPDGGRLVADFVVETGPEQVFAVLIDDERFDEFIPYVVAAETVARSGTGARVRVRARRFGFFDFTVLYERRYFPDQLRVTWHDLGGFFRRDDGSWTLARHPRGTHVTYAIVLDPGFFVPDFLLDFALRQGLPEMSRNIRLRAESGGKWRKPR